MSTNEENNKSQENNLKEKIIKTNETVEIVPILKDFKKNVSQKKSEEDKKSYEENQNLNKSEKPLTEEANKENNKSNEYVQKKEEDNEENNIKEKPKSENINDSPKEIYNANNEEENDKDDLTNIKYVTQEELAEIEKSQEKEKNKPSNNYNNNNKDKDKLITIKDLQQNPKEKLIINSPKSLKALYDSGYSLKQLYYKTFDEFLLEHKEVMHIDESARINRYHFYEQLRQDKINSLVQYREQLIQDEILMKKNNEIKENNKYINENNEIKPMKSIILDNDKRIAKEEINIIQKKHDKELANIIQLELDKDLFNLEMMKQEDN